MHPWSDQVPHPSPLVNPEHLEPKSFQMSVKWIGLEINRGQPVEKQVDDIVKTFDILYKQAEQRRVPNVGQVVKAVKLLRPAIVDRVTELEHFYRANDVDSRSSRFEAARVKLKRLLKP